MVEVVASQTTVVIVFSAAAALAIGITALIVGVIVFAAFAGQDPVRDVQRFVELTEEARSLLPKRPLLADPNGETSAAIGRFLTEKEAARRALWASRQSPIKEQVTAEREPRSEGLLERQRDLRRFWGAVANNSSSSRDTERRRQCEFS